MTFVQAAFWGMGLVVLFGLVAVIIAYWPSATGKRDNQRHAH